MPAPPPVPQAAVAPPIPLPSQDIARRQLHTLSVLVYVFAALCALAVCFTAMIVGVGLWMETTAGNAQQGGRLALAFYSAVLVVQVVMLALLVLTGRALRAARRYRLCMVTAALLCPGLPLGTALGVALLVVLQRPGVRALFDADGAAAR
ncbi:hypothetical protein [Pseudoxanthomonas koreensis]|uniref:hypothetical protein n=1 Tax=Pseudoxanthomonas koreensis TaxID=266061 RepID=UPI0035A71C80